MLKPGEVNEFADFEDRFDVVECFPAVQEAVQRQKAGRDRGCRLTLTRGSIVSLEFISWTSVFGRTEKRRCWLKHDLLLHERDSLDESAALETISNVHPTSRPFSPLGEKCRTLGCSPPLFFNSQLEHVTQYV